MGCNCTLCASVPLRRKEWEDNKYTQFWHKATCDCTDCEESRRMHVAYKAALKKHEVYSELSFIVHEHRLAERFLNWLYDKIQDPRYRDDHWWAISSLARTCASWIVEWQNEFLPRTVWAVSGIVSYDWDWDNAD